MFDSAYRMLEFKCNYATNSYRELDGADKMTVFFDGAAENPPGTPTPKHINPLLDVSPGGLNQYTSLDTIGQTYDSNGALANIAAATPIDYEYDSQDRLVHIKLTLAGPPINTYVSSLYVYDADGRRVATCVAGPSWRWDFWRGNQVIEESNLVTGAKYREYVDGAGIDEHLRMTDHTPPVGGPKDYYYHCNSQGSTGAMTDSTGAVVETYEYGWFGLPTYATQINLVTGNPYMFQGRRADSDSGLYYFRNRYYDPKRDEFRTIDPSGMWRHGQGNGYSAFGGDPWNWRDPFGLLSDCCVTGKPSAVQKGAFTGRFNVDDYIATENTWGAVGDGSAAGPEGARYKIQITAPWCGKRNCKVKQTFKIISANGNYLAAVTRYLAAFGVNPPNGGLIGNPINEPTLDLGQWFPLYAPGRSPTNGRITFADVPGAPANCKAQLDFVTTFYSACKKCKYNRCGIRWRWTIDRTGAVIVNKVRVISSWCRKN